MREMIDRHFLRSCVVAIWTLTWLPMSFAQEKSPVGIAVGQPTIVLSTSKLEQLMSHVTYILRAVNQPELGGMAMMLANQYTRGLDRDRPIGVLTHLDPRGNPEAVFVLPIADLKGFFAGINTFEPEDLGDGLYTLDIGAQPIFMKSVGKWLVVAQQEEIVSRQQAIPDELLQQLANQYDVGVKLDWQSVPAEVKSLLLDQLRAGFEMGSAQLVTRTERRLDEEERDAKSDAERQAVAEKRAAFDESMQMQAAAANQLEELLRGMRQLVLGLVADQANKQVVLETAVEFLSDSTFDQQLQKSAATTSRFLELVTADAPVTLRSTESIPENQQPALEKTLTGMLETVGAQAAARAHLALTDDDWKLLKDILIATVREGVSDTALSVSFQDGFHLDLAARVADGRQVAALAEKVAAAVDKEQLKLSTTFNAYSYQNTMVHLGSVALPAEADPTLRQILTDNVSFAIGTADKAVYLSLGPMAEANLKADLDRSLSKISVPERPMEFRFKLYPILEYVQSIAGNPMVEAMLQAAQSLQTHDTLAIYSRMIPHGVVVRLAVEEGVLKSIGAALKAGTRNRNAGF
jgi:hypothetical protein